MSADTDDRFLVGRILSPFGVRGWVRVYSYTEPRERIVQYNPWQLANGPKWTRLNLLEGRRYGKSVVARLEGFEDVDGLSPLLGAEIAILRHQLPALGEQEFYWKDLLGLQVRTGAGVCLGRVDRMIGTGANDVMVVKGDKEHLLPWVMGAVVKESRSRRWASGGRLGCAVLGPAAALGVQKTRCLVQTSGAKNKVRNGG